MRPVSEDSSGAAPPESVSLLDSLSPSDMSLLQSLDPVQSWLGQELEKCGIDAVIYTRYVLSLLLHDSYDYDLQDQENDIFLGWEKGAGKKWGKSSRRKGGTDLSLEEIKKQAAVQCLRSASDENSGVESLVEELCSKLKDIQNKQKEKEKQTTKRSDESRSPELAESPSSKDQVEMYYKAFPPLSEKPVCLQEIMTVWNKAKASAYSSSSSAAPQTSTDTSSPKDCTSEGDVCKDKAPDVSVITTTINEKVQHRRNKKEKENRYHGGASGACSDQVVFQNKRHVRHRSDLGHRPRSWSSGSSEGGSSSSGNQGEAKSFKESRIRHRFREVGSKNKKWRHHGQVKLALRAFDKEERRNTGSSCSASEGPLKHQQHYTKKSKKPLRELRKDPSWVDLTESVGEANNNREYMEEPLWYTEPISDYFVPFGWSKLETKYRSKPDSPSDLATAIDVDSLSEQIQGICIANTSFQRAYLTAGTFVDGHFVEVSTEENEEATELNGTSSCPLPEDGKDLDDEHLSEFTHFYEVDIYQSTLDPSASNAVQESRILNMIRQKSNEPRDFEAGCCVVLDGFELQGESAIKADSLGDSEDDVILTQDMENLAHMWECCSWSSSVEVEGESCAGDSPVRLSPLLGSLPYNLSRLSDSSVQDVSGSTSTLNNCFSLFEVQSNSSAFPFSCDSLTSSRENVDSSSCLDPHANKQSRLLIWTKNSAFDENEHCSNLSTRTCSPWSHSEETRSDIEQVTGQADEFSQFGSEEPGCILPPVPTLYLEGEFLDFLQESPSHKQDEVSAGILSNQTVNKVSKLESVCGIALEQDEGKQYNAVLFSEDNNQQNEDYSSGIIKDIWMAIGDRDCVLALEVEKADDFSEETPIYHCGCLDSEVKKPIEKKAVQRSEYHLWEGQKEDQGLAKNKVSKVDGGDYATPARPWDVSSERDSTSFILGGVYGELKTLSSDEEWTVVQPITTCGSLLQCAAASSSDVVTIAGTDVFMNTGSCFAPGHKPLWRPLMSFGQNGQTTKGSGEGLNKGFSVIFHEDLLGSCGGYCGEQQGLDYSFSPFDLNNPFSQVLHVECSFEPENMASFSPGFKPKSILCSNSDNEPFSPRLYGINHTQYRAIRISPRTHFRPISASELSPGCCSVSDGESEKEEMSLPLPGQTDLFDDPQADLKPLEEDAECEGHYYGKSELESGKFLPRLKKSGMEKSAQTSLDSQEGGGTTLTTVEQEIRLDCEVPGKSAAAVPAVGSRVELPVNTLQKEESCVEREACTGGGESQLLEFGKSYDTVQDLDEVPLLRFGERSVTSSQREDCWWQNTFCSSMFAGSRCTESSNI